MTNPSGNGTNSLFINSSKSELSDWSDHHSRFDLLARIASLYYLEEKTQGEIARKFGLSRQKVQRLLKQAREQGVVEIHIHSVPVYHIQLEERLKSMFGLREVLIASYHPDEPQRRRSVAQVAAGYLERNLYDGAKIAVGLGRNTSEVANCFYPSRHFKSAFISAMGGSPKMGDIINPNEICSRFAQRSMGQAVHLYAPAYVEDEKFRDMLLSQEAVKTSIDLARQADFAIMGIGTADKTSILVTAGSQPLEDVRRLSSNGAVGEVVGNYFDLDGRHVKSNLDGRVINLSLKEIAAIPNVIAVATELEKEYALLGALRTRVINTLVVDCQLAINVLRLAGVTDLEEEHNLLGL